MRFQTFLVKYAEDHECYLKITTDQVQSSMKYTQEGQNTRAAGAGPAYQFQGTLSSLSFSTCEGMIFGSIVIIYKNKNLDNQESKARPDVTGSLEKNMRDSLTWALANDGFHVMTDSRVAEPDEQTVLYQTRLLRYSKWDRKINRELMNEGKYLQWCLWG